MMGRFLTMLMIGGGAVAQQPAPPAPSPGPQRVMRQMRPPPPVMAGERADLPMELAGGMPVIVATVNGRGPYRFGVDTGAAGYLRVSPALAQTLALRQVGEALAGDPSGRNPRRIPIYSVESLTFGGLTFAGVSTTPMPDLGPRAPQVDGIIGVGFFERLLLTLDYGAGRFSAGPGALPVADARTVLQVTFDRGLPSLPVRIGEAEFRLHLDTGNTAQPLFLPAETIATLPTSGAPRSVGRARTVSQTVEIQAIDLAVPVRVGATQLPVTSVGYPSVAPPGNLGSLALQTMVVTLDYANARVRIVPSRP